MLMSLSMSAVWVNDTSLKWLDGNSVLFAAPPFQPQARVQHQDQERMREQSPLRTQKLKRCEDVDVAVKEASGQLKESVGGASNGRQRHHHYHPRHHRHHRHHHGRQCVH
ncbi:hypothetical protein ACLKA7_006361 [Drosophila subpalustris]